MQLTINKTEHEVPFDISQIPLGKFIEYQDEYGKDLDKELTELLEKKYEGDDESITLNQAIDYDNHVDKEALAWFSFWTKYDFNAAKDLPEMVLLLTQFRVLRQLLKESSEQIVDLPATINWMGEEWTISDYRINPSSIMSFNEVITSKEVMRQIHKLSRGQWHGLPYLCAVFLRKKDEPFVDEMIIEDGERLTLFKELPLEYALQVAFFLSVCVSIWSKTLASSNQEAVMESLK